MHHPSFSNVIFALVITLSTLPSTSASCYYPDGSFPTDYTFEACSGDSAGSSCCIPSEGDICLSNGLCQFGAGSTYFFRGACTDKDWNSPNCFQHCKQGDGANKWQKVISCGGNKYCCYSSSSVCCNDDTQVFEVASGSTINDYTSLTPEATAVATGGASSVTSAVYTTTGLLQIPTARSSAASASPTSVSPTSGSPTGGSPTGVSTPSTQSAFQRNKVAIIAGIVGGLCALVALFIGYRCARSRYAKKNTPQYPIPPFNPPPAASPYQPPVAQTPVPMSPPMWTKDPVKVQPWAQATPISPVPSEQPQQWRAPELDSHTVQHTSHGGVVYEAAGAPTPMRYEIPTQTRPLYEAP